MIEYGAIKTLPFTDNCKWWKTYEDTVGDHSFYVNYISHDIKIDQIPIQGYDITTVQYYGTEHQICCMDSTGVEKDNEKYITYRDDNDNILRLPNYIDGYRYEEVSDDWHGWSAIDTSQFPKKISTHYKDTRYSTSIRMGDPVTIEDGPNEKVYAIKDGQPYLVDQRWYEVLSAYVYEMSCDISVYVCDSYGRLIDGKVDSDIIGHEEVTSFFKLQYNGKEQNFSEKGQTGLIKANSAIDVVQNDLKCWKFDGFRLKPKSDVEQYYQYEEDLRFYLSSESILTAYFRMKMHYNVYVSYYENKPGWEPIQYSIKEIAPAVYVGEKITFDIETEDGQNFTYCQFPDLHGKTSTNPHLSFTLNNTAENIGKQYVDEAVGSEITYHKPAYGISAFTEQTKIPIVFFTSQSNVPTTITQLSGQEVEVFKDSMKYPLHDIRNFKYGDNVHLSACPTQVRYAGDYVFSRWAFPSAYDVTEDKLLDQCLTVDLLSTADPISCYFDSTSRVGLSVVLIDTYNANYNDDGNIHQFHLSAYYTTNYNLDHRVINGSICHMLLDYNIFQVKINGSDLTSYYLQYGDQLQINTCLSSHPSILSTYIIEKWEFEDNYRGQVTDDYGYVNNDGTLSGDSISFTMKSSAWIKVYLKKKYAFWWMIYDYLTFGPIGYKNLNAFKSILEKNNISLVEDDDEIEDDILWNKEIVDFRHKNNYKFTQNCFPYDGMDFYDWSHFISNGHFGAAQHNILYIGTHGGIYPDNPGMTKEFQSFVSFDISDDTLLDLYEKVFNTSWLKKSFKDQNWFVVTEQCFGGGMFTKFFPRKPFGDLYASIEDAMFNHRQTSGQNLLTYSVDSVSIGTGFGINGMSVQSLLLAFIDKLQGTATYEKITSSYNQFLLSCRNFVYQEMVQLIIGISNSIKFTSYLYEDYELKLESAFGTSKEVLQEYEYVVKDNGMFTFVNKYPVREFRAQFDLKRYRPSRIAKKIIEFIDYLFDVTDNDTLYDVIFDSEKRDNFKHRFNALVFSKAIMSKAVVDQKEMEEFFDEGYISEGTVKTMFRKIPFADNDIMYYLKESITPFIKKTAEIKKDGRFIYYWPIDKDKIPDDLQDKFEEIIDTMYCKQFNMLAMSVLRFIINIIRKYVMAFNKYYNGTETENDMSIEELKKILNCNYPFFGNSEIAIMAIQLIYNCAYFSNVYMPDEARDKSIIKGITKYDFLKKQN